MDILILLFLILGFIFNVLPWLLAICSKKAQGHKKVLWFIISFFISWLGYFLYYFIVIKPEWQNQSMKTRVFRNENGMPIK
ncbi:MAG: hypothetical protein ACJARP_003247 [Vicingaceae bacterium]|jgi:hypothetical protein